MIVSYLPPDQQREQARQFVVSFLMELETLSERASRLLRNPSTAECGEVLFLADACTDWRDALFALEDHMAEIEAENGN